MAAVTNKGAGSTPNAPDTQTMIKAQNDSNVWAAQQQQALNQISQITPYGQLTYEHPDPSNPNATVAVQSLSSPEQTNLDNTQTAQNTSGQLVNAILQANLSGVSNGSTPGGLQYGTDNPSGGTSEQALQNSILAQINPQIQQQGAALDTSLRNQGLTPGSDAYNNAWRQQDQSNTQAQLQAVQAGDNLYFQNANLQNQALAQIMGYGAGTLNNSYVTTPGQSTVTTPTANIGATDALGAYATNYQDALNTHNVNYAQNQALINYGTNTISQFAGAAGAAGY